jgi:transcriptional regulator with XRE-family HTH domain
MATEKVLRDVATAPNLLERVGWKIRKLRLEKDWSLQMLADHAGIEKAHLGRLELGEKEAGLLILQKIADALEVELWELLREG